jgi:hypothetical protein
MAFKLTKTQQSKINEMAGALREKQEQINAIVAATNEEIQKLVANDIAPLIEEYNKLLEDTNEFIQDIATTFRGEFDDKSEAWQEGDRGAAVAEFIEAFEAVSIEEVEAPEVSEITVEFNEDGDAETLEGLPVEVE